MLSVDGERYVVLTTDCIILYSHRCILHIEFAGKFFSAFCRHAEVQRNIEIVKQNWIASLKELTRDGVFLFCFSPI